MLLQNLHKKIICTAISYCAVLPVLTAFAVAGLVVHAAYRAHLLL